ncbi:glycosyltransferase [Candidatus Saccharibacteria bacterium]|nr:glycosyltransferase [Candidatus Saccharibacteria bacterium]
MKIVIATAVFYPQINGVAVFSYNLAMGLARRGHEVMVICPSRSGKRHSRTFDGVRMEYLKSIDVKVYPDQVHAVPKRRQLFYKHGFHISLFPKREVGKLLSDFHPDVVHVQVSDPIGLSVVGWAKKHHVPVVTTEHNQPEVLTDPLHMPSFLKKPANAVLTAYFRNRQGKSDFVTMPTRQAIDNLLKDHDLSVPVAAVSNGVDLTRFKPGKPDASIYQKYGIDPVSPTVLYVGRVDPEKKVGKVIEAFLEMVGEIKAQLVIVGDGVDKARLEREYAGSNAVHFLGRVVNEDLSELYRVGDVFATASDIETQGIVLIEAAASGLPLIAVNAGAVSEVCINEENGFLCEPGSVSEMAKAMKKILTDKELRERFSKKSLEIAKEHDFETTLDRFINIYNRVTSLKS